jgi:hypothetical protein
VAQFEFDGRSITVIPTRELTLGDLAYIKEHFEIDSQATLEEGFIAGEPDAWRGLLIASIRRVMPDVSPTHAGIDDVPIAALYQEMAEEGAAWLEKKAAEAEKAAGRARPTVAKRSSTRGASGDPRSV